MNNVEVNFMSVAHASQVDGLRRRDYGHLGSLGRAVLSLDQHGCAKTNAHRLKLLAMNDMTIQFGKYMN